MRTHIILTFVIGFGDRLKVVFIGAVFIQSGGPGQYYQIPGYRHMEVKKAWNLAIVSRDRLIHWQVIRSPSYALLSSSKDRMTLLRHHHRTHCGSSLYNVFAILCGFAISLPHFALLLPKMAPTIERDSG